MRQMLGWGVGLIVVGLVLGLVAVMGVVVAAFLPFLAGILVIVGIVMAVAAAGRTRPRETRT